MLTHEGGDRSSAIDLKLAASMSLLAGALNAAGFQAAGLFSANMTGNFSSLADHLAIGSLGIAVLLAGIILVFVLGSFSASCAILAGRQLGVPHVHARLIGIEALLLAALGVAGWLWSSFEGAGMIAVLSFALGLQNAVTTNISRARVRTTHVSGMATDIGLALGAAVFRTDLSSAKAQLLLHSTTILSFLIGGILGALGFLGIGSGVFIVTATAMGLLAWREAAKSAPFRK